MTPTLTGETGPDVCFPGWESRLRSSAVLSPTTASKWTVGVILKFDILSDIRWNVISKSTAYMLDISRYMAVDKIFSFQKLLRLCDGNVGFNFYQASEWRSRALGAWSLIRDRQA